VKAGTPPQSFDVTLGTKVQNLWVPVADDCLKLNSTTCGSSRGVLPFAQRLSPGFQSNMSSTWEAIGIYELGIGRNLGIPGNGFNGFDTIAMEDVKLEHEPVIAYASPGFWLGQLGLLPSTLNFSNTISSPSLLRSLKDAGHVPSLSYGYQAGAAYRNAKVPGSLIIGGYDRSRASTPALTVPISDTLGFNVGVQDAVATNTLQGTLSLISNEKILAAIDSSVPELWLPRSICDKFESAFGLQYHEASDRYILNDTIHTQLLQRSPTLAFTIGSDTSVSGNTTIIRLPYSAFDLEASFPIFAQATKYFPIRRAANETQYTIGRAFLQEAYLGVDWERNVFNISQAAYADPMPSADVVTILPLPNITTTNGTIFDHKKTALSGGAIAGIVIGCVAAVVIALLLLWFTCARRRRNSNTHMPIPLAESAEPESKAPWHDSEDTTNSSAELMGSGVFHELPAKHGQHEIHGTGNGIYELPPNQTSK
jgi:hypothetical protein